MTLKRPVTLPQARRWPAAAARRESFCARMGGMREQLTSDRVARDPRSKINQALAAWDCDRPELLKAAHVSRGVREMKITRKMVGSEAKNPRARSRDKIEAFPSKLDGYGPRKGLEGPFLMKNGRVVYYDPAEGAYYDPGTDFYLSKDEAAQLHSNPARKPARAKNPARQKLARIMVTDDKTGEKSIQTVPYDFAIKAYIGPVQHDFFVRSEGATLVVSEKSTGLRVGAVPYMKRYATMNDREAAKGFLAETVQRVGPEKFRAAIAKAPKIV